MSGICDRALDHRTKAVKDMVGQKGEYEAPRSRNMLSHLTSDRAFNDYQKETTRKLIRQQEELLRNLTKVRQQMELEEAEIGLTRDYYSGSREDKFGHTFDKADKLRKSREKIKALEREENKLIIQAHAKSGIDPEGFSHLTATSDLREDERAKHFGSDIQRLKNQVSSIANRYYESGGKAAPNAYLYDQEYFPGQCYFQDEKPGYYYMPSGEQTEDSINKLPTILQADGSVYKLVKIE